MPRLKPNAYNPAKKLWEASLTEEHIVKEIVQRLWLNGVPVFRIRERIPRKDRFRRIISSTSMPGVPDLVGYYKTPDGSIPAVALFLEVKKPGAPRRFMQEQFIGQAQKDRCIAGFVESWEDVVALFKMFGVDLKI